MESDGVSEVFGAVLAFAITSLVVLLGLLLFSNASDRAEEVSLGQESLALAERVEGILFQMALLEDEPSVTYYEVDLELPRTIQGERYVLSLVGDNIEMTAGGINVVYPVRAATMDAGICPSSLSEGIAVFDQAGDPGNGFCKLTLT